MPSSPAARRATMPRPRSRWGSACSATSPSRRNTRSTGTGWRASPSSISTSTTATAPRICCGTSRGRCSVPPTRCRSTPASGAAHERGAHGNVRQRAAAARERRRGDAPGLRRAHLPGHRRLRAPNSSWSRPGSTPMPPIRWPSSPGSRRISPGSPTRICDLARAHAQGRVVSTLEGGYDLAGARRLGGGACGTC